MAKKTYTKVGRPSEYNERLHPAWVRSLAAIGETDSTIIISLGISAATFYRWKQEHPEFQDALNVEKLNVDEMVEASLFKRAMGYSHIVQKPMVVSDGSALGSHIEIVEYTEKVTPDTTAQIFWLKNRQREKWRENPDGGMYDKNKSPLKIEIDMTGKIEDAETVEIVQSKNTDESKTD